MAKDLSPKKKSTKQDEELLKIITKIEDAKDKTSTWATKQDRWHRMRMRIKKEKSFPFPGCSNLRMPTIEKTLRKYKAGVLNTLFGIRPIVQAVPSPSGDSETALKIEKFLDHLCMNVIDNFEEKVSIIVDQECEKGFYLAKPYWKLEITTRQVELSDDTINSDKLQALFIKGEVSPEDVAECAQALSVDVSERVLEENGLAIKKGLEELLQTGTKVNITVKDVLKDYPDIATVSPELCYVPGDAGAFVEDSDLIVHELFLPLRNIKRNSREDVGKGWIKSAVAQLEKNRSTEMDKALSEETKDEREGITRLQKTSGLVKVWEVYCWYDIDNDGEDEKVVFTIAPEFKLLLRKIQLPFDSGKFPFVKFQLEHIDNRWFSPRGIPELIEDISKEIDLQHMQKLDQQTIRNAPMFLYRPGLVNPNLVQFIPGQGIPVKGTMDLEDNLRVLNNTNTNVEYSYEREGLLLNTELQELIAQPDFSLQSVINKRQPRTLGEVEMQSASLGGQFALDIRLQTRAFSELLTQIWEMWNQYGPESYEFNYFGPLGTEGIKLTKEEIQGKYIITVRGNDQNTNPNIRLQKAQAVLQGANNPAFLQYGIVTPQVLAEAWKTYLQYLDIPNIQKLIPQQIQPPDPALQAAGKLKGTDLTDIEMAQILEKIGISPDIQGRAAKAMDAGRINQNGKI